MKNFESAAPAVAGRTIALGAAVFALVFGFVPIVNWLSRSASSPWYGTLRDEWVSGSAIVLGGALAIAIIARRVGGLWYHGALHPAIEWAHRHSSAFAFCSAATAAILYGVVASEVFSRVPISIDELVQLVQARTFAEGRLWRPASEWPEFYSILNVVDLNGRYYSQFPPGWSALLALGVLVGTPWIVGPLCGAVSVAAFWQYVRVAEPNRGVAVGAVVLFALAPFMVFMAGSHMNHVPALMWIVLAMAAMARVVTSPVPRPAFAFGGGLSLGFAATIRPVDAVAFAIPVGVWYLARTLRDRARWRETLAAGAGVALPLALMLWVNARTTGAPFLFGYQVLWGKGHDLGFHAAPWGVAHTPARGLELINLYFLRLQTYLYEASVPSLLPCIGALCLVRRVGALDRYLLASAALIVGLYFAYWHDGFLFGPRFVFSLLPLLALWTARFPALIRERFGDRLGYRTTWYAYAIAAVLATTVSVPVRTRDYAGSFVPMRLDFLGPARQAGVDSALVFVRESWGTQLMARMWALGIPRSGAETLYGKVDACALEQGLSHLERSRVRDAAAVAALVPLLRDSARTIKSPWSPDVTERYLPGMSYAPLCAQRIADDRRGFTLLAPLLYRDWGTNVYARDLHERNVELARRYPDRPMYLLRPVSNDVGALLELTALPRDSVLAAWQTPE